MHHGEVALIVLVTQIIVKVEELMGCEHALVDEHTRRQRAKVHELAFAQVFVHAQHAARVLADDVEGPLETFPGKARAGLDEELCKIWHGSNGGRTKIGARFVVR